MIKQLRLENFRGFRDHTAELDELSVIIGRNNAGKSSFIEAIRILATVTKELATGKYTPSPPWVPVQAIGLSTSLSEVERKSDAFFHKYSAPPAIISALFGAGEKVSVYIGHDQAVHVHAVDASGHAITSRSLARKAAFPAISILPQISPIRDQETTLQKTYVNRCMETHLASRHFRNQIRYNYSHFDTFSELFDATWPSVAVWSFDSPKAMREDPLHLMLREDGFVAEVADFGHGIQMWLQIIWFLSRTNANNIVILDEPDVYLHPEQQASIVKLIRGRFCQCVLATHSRSIIECCTDAEVMRLDRALSLSQVGMSKNDHERMLQLQKETEIDLPIESSTTFEVFVTARENAAVSIKTSDGQLLLSIPPSHYGKKHKIATDTRALNFRLLNPSAVEISVNSELFPLDNHYGSAIVEFTIDPSDF